MAQGWKQVRLADSIDLQAGFAFKSQFFSNDPKDIPLVKGENVSQGKILWNISKRWEAADWKNLKKFHLTSGDVIVAMDRPWVPAGLKWAFIRDDDPKALLVQRCARLRSNTSELDQKFLRFVIGGQGFENYVKPITTGVNVPHISGQQILDYEFSLPPLPIQKRIAGILSAYDDLIENNQRRIRILEEMARSLYREWFVHFRYPGHESVPLVDSPLGPIPQGWEIVSVSDVYDTASGGTPSRKVGEYYGEDYPWVKTRELKDAFILQTDEHISSLGLKKSSAKLFLENTVIIAMYGATIGKLGILSKPAATNQACAAILGKEEGFGRAFAFCFLKENRRELIGLGQGAAQQNISQVILKSFPFLRPSKHLAERFSALVEPMLDSICNLQEMNSRLRQSRDLLLPKLVSGEVAVVALEEAV